MIKWVYRNAFHYVAGGITGWFIIDDPVGAVVLMLAFLSYEITQDWRKKDFAFQDILEFVATLFVIATGLKIWEVIK